MTDQSKARSPRLEPPRVTSRHGGSHNPYCQVVTTHIYQTAHCCCRDVDAAWLAGHEAAMAKVDEQ